MTEKKKRRGVLERAAEVFDLPGEALAGMPRLELTGNRRMHIEGHRGILEYGSTFIAVNGGAKVLKVYGSGLEIVSMTADELLVTGNVQRFEFE